MKHIKQQSQFNSQIIQNYKDNSYIRNDLFSQKNSICFGNAGI